MTKLIWALLGLLFVCIQANACDVCGVSATGNEIGWIDNLGKTHIRLSMSSYTFGTDDSVTDGYKDQFQSISVLGRININKKWRASFVLPYALNTRTYDQEQMKMDGFSDLSGGLHYVFLQGKKLGEKGSLYLEGGLTVTVPTGKYNPSIHDLDLPDQFNPGRGNLSQGSSLTFVYRIMNVGLIGQSGFSYSFKSKDGYQFGHQQYNELAFFYQHAHKDAWKFLVRIGGKTEWVSMDKYANGNLVPETGGQAFFGKSGFLISKARWNIGADFGLPVYQSYGATNVKAQYYSQLNFSINL